MSNIDCGACNDLRDYAPHFVQNGITSTECNSLKNDTGLNPSLTTLHTNCEDLDDVNDCLVGRMDGELEAYETCDWKKFMHKFIPNLYELEKAILCGDCGQWSNIHFLHDRLSDLCQIVMQSITNNMSPYGILTGIQYQSATERMGGEILAKNGTPLVVKEEEDTDNNWNGVGIMYLKKELYDCDGVKRTYEWIQPYFRDYYYNDNLAYKDTFWRVSIDQLHQWGVTDYLIEELRKWPQWWDGYSRSWGEYFESSLYLIVVGDYLELRIIGSLGDFHKKVVNGYTLGPDLYIS